MVRRSLLVALAVTAPLLLASANAFAEAGTTGADTTATTQTETPLGTVAPTAQSRDAGQAVTLQDATPTPPPGGAAPAPVVPPTTPSTPPASGTTPPASGTTPSAATPAPPPAAVALPAPAPPAPPAPQRAQPVISSVILQPASGASVSTPVPAAPSRGAPAAGAPSEPASLPESGLERVLPAVERDLRKVQADVEAIRRRLDRGATPPASRVSRLRSRLERLTPVLRRLDAQVGAVGAPSQEVQQLLHRVRDRLAATQASSAGLIGALRRSGLHGPELRGLMRELESFRALGSVLDLSLGVAVGQPTPFVPAPTPLGPQQSAATGTRAAHAAVAPSSNRAAAPSRAEERPAAAAGHEAPAPWSPGPGSATVSAGGALSVAGFVSLAVLLIGLSLPRLLARFELAPGRGHMVASALALERPD